MLILFNIFLALRKKRCLETGHSGPVVIGTSTGQLAALMLSSQTGPRWQVEKLLTIPCCVSIPHAISTRISKMLLVPPNLQAQTSCSSTPHHHMPVLPWGTTAPQPPGTDPAVPPQLHSSFSPVPRLVQALPLSLEQ